MVADGTNISENDIIFSIFQSKLLGNTENDTGCYGN